ncbi:MAG: hypothetical protein ACM3ZA_03825 [Bacillota bacterium]
MMEQQGQPQTCLMIVDLDQFVPQDHLLRKIKAKVDFSFIYEKVRPLYASKGRPSIDPVRLVNAPFSQQALLPGPSSTPGSSRREGQPS